MESLQEHLISDLNYKRGEKALFEKTMLRVGKADTLIITRNRFVGLHVSPHFISEIIGVFCKHLEFFGNMPKILRSSKSPRFYKTSPQLCDTTVNVR